MPIGPQTLGDVVEPMPSRLATFKDPDTPDHIVLDQYSLTHFTSQPCRLPVFLRGNRHRLWSHTRCNHYFAPCTFHTRKYFLACGSSGAHASQLASFCHEKQSSPQGHFISHAQYTLLGIPLPPSHSTPSLLCLSHESGKSVFLAFHTPKRKNRAMVSPGNEAGSLPWRNRIGASKAGSVRGV